MNTRPPGDFLAPFAGKIAKLYTLTIPGEQNAHPAAAIAEAGEAAGIDTLAKRTIRQAVAAAGETPGARVLICGSLYLAGHVLAADGTLPT
jgi:dihydrofolate synthase/folylpolyglutamate synthase